MVKKLRHLWGRVEIRVLVLLVFGFLLAGLALAVAQTLKASSSESSFQTVSTWDDLIKQYLDFREHNYALVVPGWYMLEGKTEGILKEYSLEELQKEPDWYWHFEDVFVFEDDSPLAKLVQHNTQVIIYEDMATGELIILSAPEKEGGDYREEIVYRAPEWPKVQAGEDYERYLCRELSQRQIVWQVTLKSRSLAEEEAAELAAAQAESEEGGVQLDKVAQEDSTTNIVFTRIRRVTNGVSMTIAYPSGFTNGLDVFMCHEIVPEIWSFAKLALPTTGTNVTWVDTNSWVYSGIPYRMYAAADATTDSDADGYPDGQEIMVYQTDPNAATSRPVHVSGTVSYNGTESGTIYVLFNTESNNWSLSKSISMTGPGGYTNNQIGNYQSYWFSAFRDVNGNFMLDSWEPRGVYSPDSTLITGDTSGIDITIDDVPSVWGQINYTGTATGDVYVVAVTDSNSWDMTYQASIPWVTVGESGEQYYATFPVSYSMIGFPEASYWIRAFIDEDTNGTFTPGEPVGQYAVNALPVSNRLTGINISLNLDSDGDGFTDYEELYLTGTSPTNADAEDLIETMRAEITIHWNLIYPQPLAFTNVPGSPADLNDMANALAGLSNLFYEVDSP